MDKKIIIITIAVIILILAMAGFSSKPQDSASTKSATSTEQMATTTNSNSATGSSEKSYTMTEVAKHASASDCWTAVRGSVYNLTSFVTQHPGGVANITKLCGIDGTSMFENKHGGSYRPEQELASLKIGVLAQ